MNSQVDNDNRFNKASQLNMSSSKKKPKLSPKKLSDFKGHAPIIEVTKHPKDPADTLATKVFMDLYSDENGFTCPRCGLVITDGDKAVIHLAEEMNKALASLSR